MKGRWVLVGILAVAIVGNVLLAWHTLTGAPGRPAPARPAQGPAPRHVADHSAKFVEAQAREAEAAYRTLVAELTEQKTRLERRAQELAERERQIVVLRQELEVQAAASAASAAQARPGATPAPSIDAPDPVKRLVRSYASMTPENAAGTLAELHGRAPRTARDIFLALPPRASGSILDVLSATRPALAAQLSLEIVRGAEPLPD